jgi:hypothetical protein
MRRAEDHRGSGPELPQYRVVRRSQFCGEATEAVHDERVAAHGGNLQHRPIGRLQPGDRMPLVRQELGEQGPECRVIVDQHDVQEAPSQLLDSARYDFPVA